MIPIRDSHAVSRGTHTDPYPVHGFSRGIPWIPHHGTTYLGYHGNSHRFSLLSSGSLWERGRECCAERDATAHVSSRGGISRRIPWSPMGHPIELPSLSREATAHVTSRGGISRRIPRSPMGHPTDFPMGGVVRGRRCNTSWWSHRMSREIPWEVPLARLLSPKA